MSAVSSRANGRLDKHQLGQIPKTPLPKMSVAQISIPYFLFVVIDRIHLGRCLCWSTPKAWGG